MTEVDDSQMLYMLLGILGEETCISDQNQVSLQ